MSNSAYNAWLELHRPQLVAQRVPETLWPKLFTKVSSSNFDAGSAVAFSYDEDEPAGCRFGLVSTKDLHKESDIFLIDHMATFEQPSEAASLLASVPAVRKRVTELLELKGVTDEGNYIVEEDETTGELKAVPEHPAKADTEIIDEILPKLWILTGSYQLDLENGGTKQLFYIMDEVGSRLAPAPDPEDAGFEVALIVDLRPDSDVTAYNVFWPVTDVGEGESCTARGLPNGRVKLNKLRSALWGFEEDSGWSEEYAAACSSLAEKLAANGYTAENLLKLLSLPKSAVGFPAQNLSHPSNRDAASELLAKGIEGIPNLLDLARLFLLNLPIPLARAEETLAKDVVDFLLDQNLAQSIDSNLTLLVQLVPLQINGSPLFVLADYQQTAGGPVADIFDPVMFIGVDSLALAAILVDLAPEIKGKTAVDLCTGSGIQALVAAKLGAENVMATDLNERAARFTRFNALLNSLHTRISVAQGNLWDPVYGKKFGVVLTNPPYIPNPSAVGTLDLFGDGGSSGEEIIARVFEGLKDYAEPNALVAMVGNLVNPASYAGKVEKWTGKGMKGKTVYGRAWSADEYAALIVQLPVTSPKVQQYAAGLKQSGVNSIANGCVVGRVEKGVVDTKKGVDEVWQVAAGIVGTEDKRKETLAMLRN